MSKGARTRTLLAASVAVVFAARAESGVQELTADLLVVGGTESGCAAAVQAARMGVTNIVLVNDIEWLGGQFSAEALAAIDENREGSYDGTVPIPRSGLFREVIDRIETLNSNKYASVARPGNTRVITTCLPSDAEHVFRDLLAPYEAQGLIARYSGYYPTQALVNADGITLEGLVFAPTTPGGTSLVVRADMTIDASDWGDAIRLSGADYAFGPDLKADYAEPSAPTSRADYPLTDMNPITYCQIVVEQTNNTPIPMPAGYDVRNFSTGAWSSLGFDQAYTSRRLVDHYAYPQIDHPDAILLNNPHVDYPLVPLPTNVVLALEALEPGASSKNIVEMTREQRQVLFDDAKQRSLGYLYYLQTVMHNSLADQTHSFLHFALSDEFGTPDHLPPKPYVRESLRLKADYVVRQQDTQGWSPSGVPNSAAFARIMYHDAVMCWQFEYDFHPTRRTFSDGGNPAGPWYASFVGSRTYGNGGTGKAVFPLRALIPLHIDGLLGAQKNLGYTSIVSSSLRLHDQCMAIGQAAGAAAIAAWDALSSQTPPVWTHLSSGDADRDGLPDADDPLPFNTNAVYWTVSIPEEKDGLPPDNVWTNAGWRGFNFTQSGAPAWTPYEQDTGAAYTNSRGYGWQTNLSANTRLRGIYPETIRDTFVFTRYQDTWRCAVSNGTYDVFFCVGDAGYDQPGQNVAVDGVTILQNVDTRAGSFCESNATVTVSDGFLTVTVGRPEGGANTTLNWLYFKTHTPDTRLGVLDGLVFWVKADADATTNAAGNVILWKDQSGHTNHAAAVDAGAPTLIVGEPKLNNRSTLRFNGTSQMMSVPRRILTNGIEGCTVIAMAKADTNDNPSIIGIRTGSGTPFLQLDQDASGHLRFIARNSAGVTANALSAQTHTGTYGMYAGTLRKGSNGVWTNNVYFSNTVPEATATASFGIDTDLTSGDQYIGGLSWTHWNGDIAEIMIYERALSVAELGEIEAYLASRYRMSRAASAVDAPNEIPGLALWLRGDAFTHEDIFADDTAESSDVVRLWSDATTNGHDASALSSPTLLTNTVNGLPAIDFTMGDSDRYVLRDSPIASDPRQLAVFAVFRQYPGDTAQNMIFTHRSASVSLIQASFQNSTQAVLQVRGSGNVLRTLTSPGLLTNGAYNVVMYQFDAVNDRQAVSVNGGTEVTDTYDFGSQTFIADTQRIGCYDLNGSDGLFLHGRLAELLVYKGVSLSHKQKNAIGFYLADKYGLATGYAPPCLVFSVR